MPELPEVEVVRLGLNPFLINQTISKVVIRRPSLRWPVPDRLPALLKGSVIEEIRRRGKYLLFFTTKGVLLIHLGMSGSLRLLRQEEPPFLHDHVDIYFTNHLILRYNDPRRFGCILWADQHPENHALLKKLGPEPLTAKFNSDYLFAKSRNRKIPIKSLVMDSRIVVGIGNIYATEALFLAGIHPAKPAGKLDHEECQKLVKACKVVLKSAIKAGGSSLRNFINADGNPGYFVQKLKAYGRENLSCLNCKTLLEKMLINQRTTVYCKKCQRL